MEGASMSGELSVAFNDAWVGFVNFDELFEVLDPEGGKRRSAFVIDAVDGQSSVFRVHLERNIQ